MATWGPLLLLLVVAVGANGQSTAGLGQFCRSGGNIVPITCTTGLSCIFNTSSPNPDIAQSGTCQAAAAQTTTPAAAGLGETCRSGGNILPISCGKGLSCALNNTTQTLPDFGQTGICQAPAGVSNSTLAIYSAIKQQNAALVTALLGGNFLAIAQYVTVDVQLVLPNISAPLTLANITTLLAFSGSLSSGSASAPVTAPVDLLFLPIDTANAITVQELAAGELGNAFITALWHFDNSTNSWLVAYGDIAPAPPGAIANTSLPFFPPTSNSTANASLGNATAGNATTIQKAVVQASNNLLAVLQSANVTDASNITNATSPYVASALELVLAEAASPVGLNFSDPTILAALGELKNGTGTGQAVLAYKQLSTQAVFLLSQVYTKAQNVFITQLWQYLPQTKSTANNTNLTTDSTWLLTFASLNAAPPGLAPNVLTLPS